MADRAVDLRRVVVRPIRATERAAFDRLLKEQHYLHSAVLVGEALRYVAVEGERWLALLAWSTAAFKCAPRDEWIGWPDRLQWRRLRLIANNARFLVLSGVRRPHLASRVLALSCRRLSRDWQAAFGHPVLLAETFVDGGRFAGTCYRAAGWTPLGQTKGFGRSGGSYYQHGVPKLIFAKPLRRNVRRLLCDPLPHPEWGGKEQGMDPLSLRLVGSGSLFETLCQVPDPRKTRGRSYRKSAGLLVLVIAAVLAGRRSYAAIAEWVQDVPEDLLRALGCTRDGRNGRCRRPSEPTLRRLLKSVDGEAVDRAFARWACAQGVALPGSVVAIDGKSLRGSHATGSQQRVHLVAAFTHREGVVIAQEQVADKSNEIPAVQKLLEKLDLEGVTVTMDAMHTQSATAELVAKKKGHYILIVKDNQPSLAESIVDAPWSRKRGHVTEDRGHGRIEIRTVRVHPVVSSSPLPNFPSTRQMIMVTRERLDLAGVPTGDPETAFAITSLSRKQASAAKLAAMIRGHWSIENSLHYVRDVTYAEDLSRVRTGSGPRVMASLRNIAIAIHRLHGEENIARGIRKCCQKSQRAFDRLCGSRSNSAAPAAA